MRQVPPNRILVTESGIASADIVSRMSAAGVGAYLIGGALMGLPEPGVALATLFENTLS
jgi:indole-3-glycerol phosphate synthase